MKQPQRTDAAVAPAARFVIIPPVAASEGAVLGLRTPLPRAGHMWPVCEGEPLPSTRHTHQAKLLVSMPPVLITRLAREANARSQAAAALEVPYPRWAAVDPAAHGGAHSNAVHLGAKWLRSAWLEHKSQNEEELCKTTQSTFGTDDDLTLDLIPLPDIDLLDKCWAHIRRSTVLVDAAPLRAYFGHDVALYFEFMRFYCVFLAGPALVSVIPFLVRVVGHSSAVHPLYAVGTTVWALLFVRYWQRRQATIAMQNGLLCDGTALDAVDVGGMHDAAAEEVRPQYGGYLRQSPVTGETERWFPSWRRKFILRPLTWLAAAAFLVPCLALQILSLNLQGYMIHAHSETFRVEAIASWSDPGTRLDPNGDAFWYLGPVVLHVLCVLCLGKLFRPVACRLTDFENHRTDDEYEAALVQKRVAFEFVDCYFVLFFVAFFLRDMGQLRSEFASIFAVDQLRRVAMEAVIPYVLHLMRRSAGRTRKKGDGDGIADGNAASSSDASYAIDVEVLKEPYDAFDDYLEMVVQFGYVAMFASAFPPAALFSWIGNLAEVRADLFKLCWVVRRPTATRAAACKPWTGILQFFSFAAIVVNSLLLSVTSTHQLDAYLPIESQTIVGRLLSGVAVEHALGLAALFIFWAVPAVPGSVRLHVNRLDWAKRHGRNS
jgi:hypothetical protein